MSEGFLKSKNLLFCSFEIKQESTSYQLTFLSYKQLKYGHAWATQKLCRTWPWFT